MALNRNKNDHTGNGIGHRSYATRHRISGGMQLAVLVSGMILTVLAYIALTMVEREIIKSNDDKKVITLIQYMEARQDQVSEMLRLLAYNASMTPADDYEGMLSGLPDVDIGDKLSRIIILSRDENGHWHGDSVATRDGGWEPVIVTDNLTTSLVRMFSAESADEHTVLFHTQGNLARYGEFYETPSVQIRPVVMGVPFGAGDSQGWLVAVSDVQRLLGRRWLEGRTDIERLEIGTGADGDIALVADYSAQTVYDGHQDESVPGRHFSFHNSGTAWHGQVMFRPEMQQAFFQYLSMAVLAMGGLLTLFGTFYVRNSQQNAYRLAAANKELLKKNYELDSEIEERERLNQALLKTKREYKAIIDSVSDVIFEASADGHILFVNETWQKITGRKVEDSVGVSLFDLLHPQDQAEQKRNFEALLSGKKSAYRAYTRLRSLNDTYRSVEFAVSMLRQDKNQNVRVVGSITDVEERMRAERALSEAEKKYRTIVENAAGGIYQLAPEGVFLSANPAMARILGYESVHKMMDEINNVHEEVYVDYRQRMEFLRMLNEKGRVHNFEGEVKRRDGGRVWVSENARAVTDDDGNILYYEGSLENIDARKHAEISLKEAKLQSDMANRAKSEFLANMSHELRTPLNSIIGFAEIIKGEVLGPIENRQYWDYANDIYDSGNRLLSIINEILDISKIEAGDRQLNEEFVNVKAVVGSALEFVQAKAGEKKLILTNTLDDTTPDIVGESLAIKQIMLNLLSNAVKFTPEGGRITISGALEESGRFKLSITDTGIGMDDTDVEKALSAFGQIETAHSRSGSGAGLGLTLVRALVKLHEGELDLFSQKGIGTTVSIIFPARRVKKK